MIRNLPNYQAAANADDGNHDLDWVVYNDTGADIANGAIYMAAWEVDATDTSNPIIRCILKAPSTEAVAIVEFLVVNNAKETSTAGTYGIKTGEYGYCKKSGYVQALCNGATDIAVGDQLEAITAATAFTQGVAATAGDSGVIQDECAAIAMEAYTASTDAKKKVMVLGKQVVCKGS